MSNFIYGKTKEAILNGEIDFSLDNFKILLVNENYVPSQNADEYVSDINSSYIKNRSNNIQNITNTLGTIDADDVLITSHNGSAFNAVVLYKVGATDSDSRIISYIDTSVGLPFTGTSFTAPVNIVWNNDQNKIFSL